MLSWSRVRRLIDDLKARPRNRRCRDVTRVLDLLGVPSRRRGSHRTFTFPGMYPFVLPGHDPGEVLDPIYVRTAVEFLEAILRRKEES